MFDKINVAVIVKDHIRTFKDYRTRRYRVVDFVLFFGIPYPLGILLVVVYDGLRVDLGSVVATALSISSALLFCVLMLAYDAVGRGINRESGRVWLRGILLREIISNISFAILVSILTIGAVLVLVGFDGAVRVGDDRESIEGVDAGDVDVGSHRLVSNLLGGLLFMVASFVYGSVILFFLTVLMLLKRVHVLLRNEVMRDGEEQIGGDGS